MDLVAVTVKADYQNWNKTATYNNLHTYIHTYVHTYIRTYVHTYIHTHFIYLESYAINGISTISK